MSRRTNLNSPIAFGDLQRAWKSSSWVFWRDGKLIDLVSRAGRSAVMRGTSLRCCAFSDLSQERHFLGIGVTFWDDYLSAAGSNKGNFGKEHPEKNNAIRTQICRCILNYYRTANMEIMYSVSGLTLSFHRFEICDCDHPWHTVLQFCCMTPYMFHVFALVRITRKKTVTANAACNMLEKSMHLCRLEVTRKWAGTLHVCHRWSLNLR